MGAGGDVERALTPLVDQLDALGVPYRIGGSVATSVYGTPRSTLDVDIVCDLREEAVQALVAALAAIFYIDADMILDAIRHRSSFNVIHLETMTKVDVFILKRRAFDQMAFGRAVEDTLSDGAEARRFSIYSPEDMILHKLEWYRIGHEISERQWLDVLGVLKVQTDRLDEGYLRQWAAELGVSELLERALRDSRG